MSKKKVIAVTEIHRTVTPGKAGDKAKNIAPVRPVVQVIAPKSVFMVSTEKDRDDGSSEYSRLLAAGAIRAPEPDEKIAVSLDHVAAEGEEDDAGKKERKARTPRKAKAKADDGSDDGSDDDADLV